MANALVRSGFANSTQRKTYNSALFTPVLDTGVTELTVPLTGFTLGNVILIAYSISPNDAISSGPSGISYDVKATIDITGGGQKRIVSGDIGIQMTTTLPAVLLNNSTGWITFYKPAALGQDPVIGLDIRSLGIDAIEVDIGSALIWAAEIDAAYVTQFPSTTLEP